MVSLSCTRRPVAIDLFSGAGGMSVGFEQAGFDIVLGVDFDAHHVAVHHRNFPYGKSIVASVADLDGPKIRDLSGVDGEVDLIFGGPPCQGFSHMGLRDSGDPRNTLVNEFARIVEEVNPRAFVMENVPGINTGDTAKIFEWAVDRFQSAGYKLAWPVRTLNAADFGVPQNRKRLFVIGIRADLGVRPTYPIEPAHAQPPRPTVWEAISDLPDVDSDDSLFKSDLCQYPVEPDEANIYARVSRGLELDPSDYSRPRKWDPETASGCLRTRHNEKSRNLYSATPQGQMVPGHKLPKLDPNGLAPTLRAGTTSERGSFTAPRPVHPFKPRVITAREAARLHGFPDWFSFFPGKWHAYRQIGNAVCPPVARAVGSKVMEALGIDPGKIARPSVELEDRFELPEDRAKNHKRIPVAAEFPKVINRLFELAFSEDSGLHSPFFDATAIEQVVDAVGAKLPRVRPDRFLAETARYRGVEKLLSLPRGKGFTIRIVDLESGNGEFVPIGTPGAIDEKDAIGATSAELNNAIELDADTTVMSDAPSLSMLAEDTDFICELTGGNWNSVVLDNDLFGLPENGPYAARAIAENGDSMEILVVAGRDGAIPRKSQMSGILKSHRAQTGLFLSPLTKQHLLAVVLKKKGKTFYVCYRRVFLVLKKHQTEVGTNTEIEHSVVE